MQRRAARRRLLLRGVEISDLVREIELSAMVIENAATGISMIDESGHYLFGNAWYRARIGSPRETLRGTHFLESVQPEIRAVCVPTITSSSSTVAPLRLKSGPPPAPRVSSSISESTRCCSIARGLGRFRLATFNDVTVQRSRDRRLLLFERVLESAPLVLFALDKEGKFTALRGQGPHEPRQQARRDWVGCDGLED